MSGTTPKRGVVICCAGAAGRWLLIRRGAEVARAPLKVGFPGGEIHDGETAEAAVRRESFEELGLAARPLRCFWQHRWGRWALEGWLAKLPSGDLKVNPQEVAEAFWLTESEALAHPDGLPTLVSIFTSLRACEDA
ncbi:MAG: NUDIX hydrolase [Phycisphaeraceae bacterium]|nr:NUDIX hydrolase [Phycisphaeraceae bacterium]